MVELTPSLEDYLEAIWVAAMSATVVRVRDLTKALKVKTPSVIGAVRALSEKGLVVHEKYGYIELTKKGERTAKMIYERHKVLTRFLSEILGVAPETSEKDACQIEHHVCRETMSRMIDFLKFVETCPEGKPIWLSNFHYYVKNRVRPRHCRLKGGTKKKGSSRRSRGKDDR